MTTYKIKLVSQTNSIILIIALLIIFLSTVGLFPHPMSGFSASILVATDFVVVYFLWQKFVTGRTEWTIDNDGISIIWTKKFVLAESKDLNIKWSEIEKISKGLDTNYYNLKIKLVSGDTIKFYHDNLVTRDDFESLTTTLYQTLNEKQSYSQQ